MAKCLSDYDCARPPVPAVCPKRGKGKFQFPATCDFIAGESGEDNRAIRPRSQTSCGGIAESRSKIESLDHARLLAPIIDRLSFRH